MAASRYPDRVVYRVLRDGTLEVESITFAELRRQALRVAAHLVARRATGDRAILVYTQGVRFIVAFLGCLYAGVAAVPASFPNRKRGLEILKRIVGDCGARWLLSTGQPLDDLAEEAAREPALSALIQVDTEAAGGPDGIEGLVLPTVSPDGLALLQYTAGSTAPPRGVMVNHANLVHNHQQITLSLGSDASTIYLSWLPMFHDMGLGIALQAIWVGVTCVLMSPQAFIQNPLRWLSAISRYRVTASGGPDFAFALCMRRLSSEVLAGLDLSCWRVAYNGSEPIRSSTIERFSNAFATAGFRREAFHPVYGLAEATLLATSEPPFVGPRIRTFSVDALAKGHGSPAPRDQGRLLVSCGRPWLDASLAIVDPDTRLEKAPGQVGEIWLQSPSVAGGYWNRDDETRNTFRATTPNRSGTFLRTGDLGFVEDGQLFVMGRLRDLIVVTGRSHYPHDIEGTVSACHPALAPFGAAAFTLEQQDGGGLVILQEVARSEVRRLPLDEVVEAIRTAVMAHHALDVQAIALLRPTSLLRTTSGKIRRSSCRTAFVDRSLPVLHVWRAAAPAATGPTAPGHRALRPV